MKKMGLYLTEQMIAQLDKINEETGIPKAEIIRRAVSDYLDKKTGGNNNDK